jgi:hypothetical protein
MSQDNPLFFNSTKVPGKAKKEILLQLIAAFREGGAKAAGSTPMTYAKAFVFLNLVSPEIFQSVEHLLKRQKQVPKIVRRFKEEASISGIPATGLIEKEIKKQEALLQSKNDLPNTKEYIQELDLALLYILTEAAEELKERLAAEPKPDTQIIEAEALERDFYTAKREYDINDTASITKDGFREYTLPNDRLMRVRLLHNRAAEAITGVDLIYEQVDISTKRVRFVHLQYKMWDGNSFRISSVRDYNQMKRIEACLCSNKFCNTRRKGEHSYRFPFCSAFYRPTLRQQRDDPQMVTTGIHLPVCFISKHSPKESISREQAYSQGLSNQVFDELFHNGLIGSAWLSIDKVEEFYKANKIIKNPNGFVLNIRDELGHDNEKLKSAKRFTSIINSNRYNSK